MVSGSATQCRLDLLGDVMAALDRPPARHEQVQRDEAPRRRARSRLIAADQTQSASSTT